MNQEVWFLSLLWSQNLCLPLFLCFCNRNIMIYMPLLWETRGNDENCLYKMTICQLTNDDWVDNCFKRQKWQWKRQQDKVSPNVHAASLSLLKESEPLYCSPLKHYTGDCILWNSSKILTPAMWHFSRDRLSVFLHQTNLLSKIDFERMCISVVVEI